MIYFIRHGLSEANVKHVFAGQGDDSPLVEEGFAQARVAGRHVLEQGLNVRRIVSSPLIRTRQTATEVAAVIGFNEEQIVYDARIIEYDMGVLTGTPHHAVTSLELVAAEGAEDPEAFRDRVVACVKQYNQLPGDTLFICHGGVGKLLETLKEGKEPKFFYDVPIWPNASVILIDWIR
jgi:probable phosphoglycerate mutase